MLARYLFPCVLAACHPQGSLPSLVVDDAWVSVQAVPPDHTLVWSARDAVCHGGLTRGYSATLYGPVMCARHDMTADAWNLRVYLPEDLDDGPWRAWSTPDRMVRVPSDGYARVAQGLGLRCLRSETGPPAFFLYGGPAPTPLELGTTRCRLPDGTDLTVHVEVVRLAALAGGARHASHLDRAARRASSRDEPAPVVVREDDLARIIEARDVEYEIAPVGPARCHSLGLHFEELRWAHYGAFGCSRRDGDERWTFRVYVPGDVAEEQWSVWFDQHDHWRGPTGQVWEEQVSPGLYLRCSHDRNGLPLFELQHLPSLATGPLAGGIVTCRVPSLGEVAATVEVVQLDRRRGGRRRFLELEKGRRRFEEEVDGAMTP